MLNVFNIFTLSPVGDNNDVQHPLTDSDGHSNASAGTDTAKWPIFPPPGGAKNDPFACSYPTLKDWKYCATPQNQGCWLRHQNGSEYNITTNFEDFFPEGVVRKVS